jgi:hypothetical protein
MNNLVLTPGVNHVTVRGDITQKPIVQALTTQPYCTEGILPFELHGKNVTKNGEEIPYFSGALQALTNKVDVPLSDAFVRAKTPLTCLTKR